MNDEDMFERRINGLPRVRTSRRAGADALGMVAIPAIARDRSG